MGSGDRQIKFGHRLSKKNPWKATLQLYAIQHCIYLIEHDHLALEMVVVVVEPTPLFRFATDRPWAIICSPRGKDTQTEPAAERGVVVEGDSCGGGEKRGEAVEGASGESKAGSMPRSMREAMPPKNAHATQIQRRTRARGQHEIRTENALTSTF